MWFQSESGFFLIALNLDGSSGVAAVNLCGELPILPANLGVAPFDCGAALFHPRLMSFWSSPEKSNSPTVKFRIGM
jgi:hypothetical protein